LCPYVLDAWLGLWVSLEHAFTCASTGMYEEMEKTDHDENETFNLIKKQSMLEEIIYSIMFYMLCFCDVCLF